MIRYLLIGDAGSMHVYNFVKNSLLGRKFDIYILSHSIVPIPVEYHNFYDSNNIKIFTARDINGYEKRGIKSAINKFIYKCRVINQLKEVDICHFHYLNIYSCILYLLFRSRIKRLVLTFWGSDILVENKKSYWFRKRCMKYADRITVSVSRTMRAFKELYGHEFDNKVQILRFMSGTIDIIKNKLSTSTADESKKNLGIPLDKIAITIGYNADPAQHQDMLISYLNILPVRLKQKLFIIVPMTYSRVDRDYINRVESEMTRIDIDGVILKDYMNYEQMADLSIASDIYVNSRDTDAFSNSMKEQLFAGTLMIQGKWLEYDELDQINWDRIWLNDRADLPAIVTDILDNHPEKLQKSSCTFIWETFSGPGVRKQWDELYASLGL